MEQHQRELLVNRILSGCRRLKVRNQTVVHKNPTREQRYIAQEVYQDELDDALANDSYTEEDLLLFLHDNGLWDDERNGQLEKFDKDIEDFKIALYQTTFRSAERGRIRKYLAEARRRREGLVLQRHAFDHLGAHGAANMARSRYLIGCSLFYLDGRRVLPEEAFMPGSFMAGSEVFDEAVIAFTSDRLDEGRIRELARTDPWRTIWSVSERCGGAFGLPGADLTDEQLRLQSWSQLYEKVEQHPNCPPDEVFDDDDVFDGWLLIQRREGKKQANETLVKQAVGNEAIANSDEVFVVCDSIEEARKVEDMNDAVARRTKKKRHEYVAKHGKVHEAQLPDVRQRLQMEFNAMQRKRAGG